MNLKGKNAFNVHKMQKYTKYPKYSICYNVTWAKQISICVSFPQMFL